MTPEQNAVLNAANSNAAWALKTAAAALADAHEAHKWAKATSGAIEALAKALGPEVEKAVKAALEEAVVEVNVNFPPTTPAA